MHLRDARGWRRGRATARVQQFLVTFQRILQAVADLVPGALVLRLFLAPDDLARVRVMRERCRVVLGREWIELLDAHDRDVARFVGAPRLEQVEVDLARAEHHARDILGREIVDLVHHALEMPLGQFVERGHRQLVPQQALRRHDDQRLAERPHHLPAQHVEHLRGRGRHAHLHVVLGAELQEALEARGRMFRPLPFVTVRQEQREPAVAAPLRFARRNELVDDHLRAVGEVAELAFPDDEAIGIGDRVAVLEAEHGFFRQQRIGDAEARLPRLQVLQRDVRRAGGLVVPHRVSMEERAAAAVLAGEADLVALLEQACIGERLGKAPVHHQLARRHLATVVHDLLHLAMQREAVRKRGDFRREVFQQRRLDSGADLFEPVDVVVLGPVHGVLVADEAEHVLRLRRAFVEAATVLLYERVRISQL